MQLEVTSSVLRDLRERAADAHPEECCGILLGERDIGGDTITAALPAANVHPNPASQFEIDPQALVDAHRAERNGGPQVLGYYHSHPNGLAEPSATDAARAAHDNRVWAIIAGDAVSWWKDTPGGFETLPYALVSG